MTGDGVDDAPVLKAAHVGMAMGGRCTDVARKAAAAVLPLASGLPPVRSVLQGLVAAAIASGLTIGDSKPALRATAFVVLIAALVVLVFVNGSSGTFLWVPLARPNRTLPAVPCAVPMLLILVLSVPPVAMSFQPEGFAPWPLGPAVVNGPAVLLVLLAAKRHRP